MCFENQSTDLSMIEITFMKELRRLYLYSHKSPLSYITCFLFNQIHLNAPKKYQSWHGKSVKTFEEHSSI